MSKDNVIIRLTNKETLNKFQMLKSELSERYTKRYTNDDVIHYLLESVSSRHKTDTLLDTPIHFNDTLSSRSDTLYKNSDTPTIHFEDFVTKDELESKIKEVKAQARVDLFNVLRDYGVID